MVDNELNSPPKEARAELVFGDQTDDFFLPAGDSNQNQGPKKDFISPKLLVVFLTILVIISSVFAVGNWFNNLKLGFAYRGEVNQDLLSAESSLINNDVANNLALQQQDTDLDGISDYDELNVYRTSPYLEDSDSDGYADFTEIENGENPNCPAGQTCNIASQTEVQPLAQTELENLTPEQIRQLLLEAGISQQELAGVDDATLKQLYSETLTEVNTGETGQTGTTGFTGLENQPDLNAITPDQLRAILLTEEGINKEDVNSLTDEELMQLWQEILKAKE